MPIFYRHNNLISIKIILLYKCVCILLRRGLAVGKHHLSLNLLMSPFLSPPHRSIKPSTLTHNTYLYSPTCMFFKKIYRPSLMNEPHTVTCASGGRKACMARSKVGSHASAAANNNIFVAVLTATYQLESKDGQCGEKKSLQLWLSEPFLLKHDPVQTDISVPFSSVMRIDLGLSHFTS